VKWTKVEPGENNSALLDIPHCFAQVKIDDKGRLKLPAESLDWCKKSSVVKVFCTTTDKKTVRIYPISLWLSTLNSWEAPGPHAATLAKVAMIAKTFGGDAEIDAQGRMTLPAQLRDAMELGPEPVYLEHTKGRMDFRKKTVHDAEMALAQVDLAKSNDILKELGF
jgi:DNA-binding transcriptional regulator/RsmH inhibitor MraZ